ncbi:hypothetical protein XU18_4235 [Perkinsela sp. CCAP 1560/4]|nr:hypothetical protein XU18_4235 [Perkinsela sp. CCAP 1560/4]|eukprot:KNH04551.1 hypothetical protein XU18_4235 [Perkinsela sp. CCAP 1560/4]
MLSQQSLMELFIFGLNEPEKICCSREDPADACEWKGVKCNGDGEVEEFDWICKNEHGTLGFEFLPCSMKTLRMFMNALSGTIQLAALPGKMEVVYISFNNLIGSLGLDRLPAAVRALSLSNNKFTANPTKGHLSVVGWTSTPVLGEAKNLFKPLVVFLSWRRPY